MTHNPSMNGPQPEAPWRDTITGMVLAGGRGARMGGEDKGLQRLHGQPLAQWALRRLRPQVGRLAVNANRNAPAYAALGVPVWRDRTADFQGPMAGLATGLAHIETPWLLTVPCDTPLFPTDLAPRLADAAWQARAPIAMAATLGADGAPQPQPVFCLLHRGLAARLHESLARGERSAWRWAMAQGCALVPFGPPRDDALATLAFHNVNTLAELRQLEALTPPWPDAAPPA